jgi:hypothetical protein
LGLQAGVNLYLYCRAGPVNYTDPTGLSAVTKDGRTVTPEGTSPPISGEFDDGTKAKGAPPPKAVPPKDTSSPDATPPGNAPQATRSDGGTFVDEENQKIGGFLGEYVTPGLLGPLGSILSSQSEGFRKELTGLTTGGVVALAKRGEALAPLVKKGVFAGDTLVEALRHPGEAVEGGVGLVVGGLTAGFQAGGAVGKSGVDLVRGTASSSVVSSATMGHNVTEFFLSVADAVSAVDSGGGAKPAAAAARAEAGAGNSIVYQLVDQSGDAVYFGKTRLSELADTLRRHARTQPEGSWRGLQVISEELTEHQALALETSLIQDSLAQGKFLLNQATRSIAETWTGVIEVPPTRFPTKTHLNPSLPPVKR